MSSRTPLIAAVLVLSVLGCQSNSQPIERTGLRRQSSSLPSDLRAKFLEANPRIQKVYVLEVCPHPTAAPGTEYALLARAIAPNPEPEINFSNELFGVFTVDSTLTRVVRVVEIFPTQRWKDYWVRFEFIGPDSLLVKGSGRTYGDQPLVRAYDW